MTAAYVPPCIKQIIDHSPTQVQNHPHNQAAPKQVHHFKDSLLSPSPSASRRSLALSFSVEQGASIPIPICVPHASVLKPGTDKKNPAFSLHIRTFNILAPRPLNLQNEIRLCPCPLRYCSLPLRLRGGDLCRCRSSRQYLHSLYHWLPDLLCSHHPCYSPRM